ncbi:MAG: HNH endonuclease [Alphaproteobacteria bacterium]|nr:HNH endonuclease [Alphaproteobacteria bacterium]MDE2041893.1 HNH endonuclease [Alphaproteobacteria bacterium]MDE2339540.1 HNH endonuclease [Alphaproteobacteria bacterium]
MVTIWHTQIKDDPYYIWDKPIDKKSRGHNEIWEILNNAIKLNHDTYGILIEGGTDGKNKDKILSFDEKRLRVLDLKMENDKIVARLRGYISAETVRNGSSVIEDSAFAKSAIEDLDFEPVGRLTPERVPYSGTFIERDDKVRHRVIKRAKGKCEHCGELGFAKPDGSHYVEANHIISLAEQGPDTLDNVIALCPNHHREAHFGEGSEQLEAEFKTKLASLRGH